MGFTEKSLFNIKRDVGAKQTELLGELVVSEDLRLDSGAAFQSKFNHGTVRRGELLTRMARSGIMTNSLKINHRSLLEPVLPTSIQPTEREVTDLRYFDDNYGNKRVAIILDDDKLLIDERKAYLNRAGHKQFEISASPRQITLARIPTGRAGLGLLARLSSEIPEAIQLDPVSTSFPGLMPRSMREAKRLAESGRSATPDLVHSLPKIPQAFIDSLRKLDSSISDTNQSV